MRALTRERDTHGRFRRQSRCSGFGIVCYSTILGEKPPFSSEQLDVWQARDLGRTTGQRCRPSIKDSGNAWLRNRPTHRRKASGSSTRIVLSLDSPTLSLRSAERRLGVPIVRLLQWQGIGDSLLLLFVLAIEMLRI